jgi:hypothetical protein
MQGLEEWQVVLAKKDDDPYEVDQLVVRVALADGVDPEAFEKRLRDEVRAATEVSPNRVEFMPLDRILKELGMETEMKEKRFLDRRPK